MAVVTLVRKDRQDVATIIHLPGCSDQIHRCATQDQHERDAPPGNDSHACSLVANDEETMITCAVVKQALGLTPSICNSGPGKCYRETRFGGATIHRCVCS